MRLALCVAASLCVASATVGVTGSSAFCLPSSSGSIVFDLSSMGTATHTLLDAAGDTYYVTAPVGDLPLDLPTCTGTVASPAVQVNQGDCIPLGERSTTAAATPGGNPAAGVQLTLTGGANHPSCDSGRSVVFNLVCDPSAPVSNPPNGTVEEFPRCTYNIEWYHPAACGVDKPGAQCPTAAVPVPTADQLKYITNEIMGLTHFNMATFVRDGDPACDSTNWNTGVNCSNPAVFNPVGLNVSNWVESYNAVGAKHAVLTAKHGCGFLIFDTATTLPNGHEYGYGVMRQSVPSFGRNVAKEFVDTLTAAGLGTGFYYSTGNNYYLGTVHFNQLGKLLPGQVNVTMDEYNSIVFAHLQELWGQYGNFTEIWLDHGFAPSQQSRLQEMLATLQPQTNAFNGFGVSPNPVKWCGTESGKPGYPLWSTGCEQQHGDPTSSTFCPTGVDTELQSPKNWFYTPTDGVRALSDLINVYHQSVGNNAVLELDFAIDRTGNVHPTHAAQYAALGNWARACYGTPLASTAGNVSQLELTLPGGSSGSLLDRFMVQEDIRLGERVRVWSLEYMAPGSSTYTTFANGTVIGHKHIEVGAANVTAVSARFTVSSSVGVPIITRFAAFSPCPRA